MNKTEIIRTNTLDGNIIKACAVARTFFFGLTDAEKESIEITADCACAKKAAFYESLGIDTELHAAEAAVILYTKFC